MNSLEARPSSEVGYINNELGDLARIWIRKGSNQISTVAGQRRVFTGLR